MDCLIIGAGISGLMAATTLQAQGWAVTVLDKGRGVGGRMATRRLDTHTHADHGAQFFTIRSPKFATHVQAWEQAGTAVEWCRGFSATGDGHARYRGVGGMSAVAKHLAQGLNVVTNTQVVQLQTVGNEWLATTGRGQKFTASRLLLTPPVPQSLALLDAGNVQLPSAERAALETILYDPCFAVLATLSEPSTIPHPGAVQAWGEPIIWIADNQQKGVSEVPTVTIHASAAFTRHYFETPYSEVARLLLEAAEAQGWLRQAAVQNVQVHRWRYAQPAQLHPQRYLFVRQTPPVIFAGDAFHEARVEGAALSGLAAAEALLAG
ncbi:MAG: FAD-dependent oxidoreductase [Chloroflexi bacterium]|nr:FAD-dependent oxidoreductase [Chloroflexota bacterium]